MELSAQETRKQKTRTEQVRLLYANTTVAVLTTLGVGLALGYLQWGVISHRTILGWLLWMLAIASARMALALRYRRAASKDTTANSWNVLFTVGAGLSATNWAAAAILLYPEAILANQVFLVFILGGMMLGAASLLAARPEAFLTFILLIGCTTTLRLLLQGDGVHWTMGLVAGIFTIATLIAAWHIHVTVRSSLDLQFENQELVRGLEIAMHRAEEALRDREQYLTLAQNTARLGVWDCDLRTSTMTISPECARLHGISPDRLRLTHKEWLDLIHSEDREKLQVLLHQSIDRRSKWDAEFRVVWGDGTTHWLLGTGMVCLDDSDRPARMTGVTLDITSRKEAELALRESEERFRRMADSAPVMMWVAGPDKVLTFFNRTWLDFVGRTVEQELNNGWVENMHPDDRERCLAAYSSAFDARERFHIEYRLRRADGEYRSVLCAGVPRFAPDGVFAGYIGSDIDLTELRRAQEETFEKQKLKSMGALINGIAHDFNNLLGGVLIQAELVETEISRGSLPREDIRLIKQLASNAAEIVRELMLYSGQGQADFGPVDLSPLVEEMLGLLKSSVSKHAVLKATLAKHLPPVRGNAVQLRQVVMNLIINASEAIGTTDRVIQVTTSFAGAAAQSCSGTTNVSGADWILLEVSDTGCGLTDEQKRRIFDPFFSTKREGRGVGLSVVQGIIASHAGTIDVQSVRGFGSRFQILLPSICKSQVDSPQVLDFLATDQATTRVGTVLVIEDEDVLRRAVSKLLRARGLTVVEAPTGTIGVDLFRNKAGEIDVVLLDMTLPGLSGPEVLLELRRIQPEVHVVITSAYSRDRVLTQIGEEQPWIFVRKPYQLNELMESLSPFL